MDLERADIDLKFIFQDVDGLVDHQTDNQLNQMKSLSKYSNYPIFVWTIKFVVIVMVLLALLIFKTLYIQNLITNIYNQYCFAKDLSVYPVYVSAIGSLTSQQFVNLTGEILSQTNNSIYFEDIYHRINNLTFSLTFARNLAVKGGYLSTYQNLIKGNDYDLIKNTTSYCDDNILEPLLKNGLKSKLSYFKKVTEDAKIFNTMSLNINHPKLKFSSLMLEELLNSSLLIFPLDKEVDKHY